MSGFKTIVGELRTKRELSGALLYERETGVVASLRGSATVPPHIVKVLVPSPTLGAGGNACERVFSASLGVAGVSRQKICYVPAHQQTKGERGPLRQKRDEQYAQGEENVKKWDEGSCKVVEETTCHGQQQQQQQQGNKRRTQGEARRPLREMEDGQAVPATHEQPVSQKSHVNTKQQHEQDGQQQPISSSSTPSSSPVPVRRKARVVKPATVSKFQACNVAIEASPSRAPERKRMMMMNASAADRTGAVRTLHFT